MRSRERSTVWFHRYPGSGTPESGLLAELARQGLECHPLPCSSEPSHGPGLLLFDAFTPDLADWIRERSRQGDERLLAIGPREALSRGAGWRLLAAGAADVLPWPDRPGVAETIAARFARWEEVDRLVGSAMVTKNLVGRSLAWRSALRQIVEVARFSASSVLLGGESGTGKELVARLIHSLDAREEKRDLVTLDCTTIVPELSGSEFFGHEKGSYTSAVAAREGAFALADGGTLFLDEVGELPLRLQAELLRVVQEGTYKRLGSNSWQKTRFRLVCATHRELLGELEEGRFRRDFYYRIAPGPAACRRCASAGRTSPAWCATSSASVSARRRRSWIRPSWTSCWSATIRATCATSASSWAASLTATSGPVRSRSATCRRRRGPGTRSGRLLSKRRTASRERSVRPSAVG
ncbi:MAG TPA: sigma-54 factor interaction domain-containing protein [Thermoanaerobaculia bacterium]|jgi:hypothetical protein